MKKHRGLKIVIAILLIILITFHAIWFYNYSKFKPFADAVGKDEWGRYSCLDDDKTAYAVFPPKYPLFDGNLSIADYRSKDLKSGDVLVDMIIWPEKKSYKIGFSIQFVKDSKINGDEENGMLELSTESVSFELDENGNFLKDYNEEDINIFNENKEIIDEYYSKAYKMWGILGDS